MIKDRNIDPNANIQLSKLLGGGTLFTGNKWYVDAANGGTNNSGKTPDDPLSTVSGALDKVTDSNQDVIFVIGGTSTVSETAITWSKSHTHLIGIAAPTMNSRARIGPSSGTSPFFTVSGDGNGFWNLRSGVFEDLNVNMRVTGSENFFENVTLQGMGNATTGDDTAGRSLVLSGAEENFFKRCTIGLDTIARSAANTELEFADGAARNTFSDCLFTKQADNTGTLFVKSTGTSGLDRWNEFHNCRWYSFWTNDSDKITAAFDLSAQTATGHIIMSGSQTLIGADDWEASASNRMYFEPATATAADIGLAINNA